jgi:SAM-dependent methyltransferase
MELMETLWQVYDRHSTPDGGGDKGTQHSYIDVYEREMTRRSDIDVLEIGVWQGHSLAMWSEYFLGSRVIGLDVDLSRLRYEVDARQCDATSAEALTATLGDSTFDYIVDDGSHLPSHQAQSFRLLWDRVKPGGKYFIEDIAGDEALAVVSQAVTDMGLEFVVYDLRELKNRFDDIIVMVTKDA